MRLVGSISSRTSRRRRSRPDLSTPSRTCSPHLAGQDLIRRVDHPSEDETLQIGPPARFSRSPAAVRRPAPLLGEHTVEVLREAGLDEAGIDALLGSGAALQS